MKITRQAGTCKTEAFLRDLPVGMQNGFMMPNRAPLAYLLVSLVAGLSLARVDSNIGLWIAFVGLGGACGTLLLAGRQGNGVWLWGSLFLLSRSAVFWSYGILRLPPVPEVASLSNAPREQEIHLEIRRVFNQGSSSSKRICGIGFIPKGSPHDSLIAGTQVYFNIHANPEIHEHLLKGVQFVSAGVLRPVRDSDTSGFYEYLRSNRMYYRFSQNATLAITREASAFRRFCAVQHARFLEILQFDASGARDPARVYVAMLLGERANLNEEQKRRYQVSGTMHLFAISGLHIGVLASVLALSLRVLRIPNRIAPFLGLPLLYLYFVITGEAPSAMRAFVMTFFFWLAYSLQRQRNPFAALMASAVAVLLINPLQLWSLGFQLSYVVVGSILLFGLPFQMVLTRWARPFRWLPENDWTPAQRISQKGIDGTLLLFAVSLSAWLGSIPLSLGHFGYLSLAAVVLNMVLVNMAALVICTGCLSLVCGLSISIELAGFINHAAWLLISAMDLLSGWVASLPGMVLETTDFPLPLSYATLIAYFIMLIVANQKPQRIGIRQLLLAPGILILLVVVGLWVA